jgi:hypothetical protein
MAEVQRHILTHYPIRWLCGNPGCPQLFARKDAVKRHLRQEPSCKLKILSGTTVNTETPKVVINTGAGKGSDDKGSDEKGSDDKGSDDKGSDNKGSDDKGNDDKGSDDKGSDDKGSDDKECEDAILIEILWEEDSPILICEENRMDSE